MLKRLALFLLTLCLLAPAPLAAEEPYKILVYGRFEAWYAEKLQEELRELWSETNIELRRFSPEAMADPATLSAEMADLAQDPLLRAVVLVEGLDGSLDGSTRLRAAQPAITIIAIAPHEDLETFSHIASLIVYPNNLARGYTLVQLARRMGADCLVEFTSPEDMAADMLGGRRHRIMEAVAKNSGLMLITDQNAPNSDDPAKRPAVREYISRAVPEYIKKYGPNCAFITSSRSLAAMLPDLVMAHGGICLEGPYPSTLAGYPSALGLEKETMALFGRWPELLRLEDEKMMELGHAGRFETWCYPFLHTVTLAMVAAAVETVENQMDIYDLANAARLLQKFSPGAKWLVSPMIDYDTGQPLPHTMLLLQDSYIFGVGYQGLTSLDIPIKYYRIK